MYNMRAKPFKMTSIMGELQRDEVSGDAVQSSNPEGDKFFDKTGRSVNKRGFLIDRKGNIINKNGEIMFRKNQLNDDGDFPKFFDFSKFDSSKVRGKFGNASQMALPIISEDPELPMGYGRDHEQNIVN